MTAPGWYEDPVGDYQLRWWDGTAWTAAVANDGHQFEDAVAEPTVPGDETWLWQHGQHALSTHRCLVLDATLGRQVHEIPLWSVARVEVTQTAGQSGRGTGRVAVVVGYPGFTDRTHWVMADVPEPHRVAAAIRKWASRHRRAAALPPPR